MSLAVELKTNFAYYLRNTDWCLESSVFDEAIQVVDKHFY